MLNQDLDGYVNLKEISIGSPVIWTQTMKLSLGSVDQSWRGRDIIARGFSQTSISSSYQKKIVFLISDILTFDVLDILSANIPRGAFLCGPHWGNGIFLNNTEIKNCLDEFSMGAAIYGFFWCITLAFALVRICCADGFIGRFFIQIDCNWVDLFSSSSRCRKLT